MKVLKFIAAYYVLDIVFIVVAILFTLWGRKRRLRVKTQKIPKGFVKTEEIFADPTTGVKQRVWFNPATGKRHYETLKE